eukprot:m.47314 g.47314  ORF g.47314 m.47314 type:complete len:175 (+) comp11256_c0_seq1:73-597(+)
MLSSPPLGKCLIINLRWVFDCCKHTPVSAWKPFSKMAEDCGFGADFTAAMASAALHGPTKTEHGSWLASKRASKNTMSRKKWSVSASGGASGEKWYQYKDGVLAVRDTVGGEITSSIPVADITAVTLPDPEKPACSFSIVTKEKTLDLLSRDEDDCAIWVGCLKHAISHQATKR